MIQSDRRLTVRMIAESLNINRDCVWKIITEELGMRKICAKMAPRLLNDGQKKRRTQVCQDIIQRLENEPDLRKSSPAMNHGFLNTTQKRSARVAVEEPRVTQTTESKTVTIQNQTLADRVL